jgi:hypothetical protein
MHESEQHGGYKSGVQDFPAEVQSFLEISARYIGLSDVPHRLLHRQQHPTHEQGQEIYEKQTVNRRVAL